MKRSAFCLLLVIGLTACTPPPTIVTPEGQKAYTANEILKRIERLQDAAIAAHKDKLMPDSVTRVIVTFAVSSAKVLDQLPDGWGPTVAAGWMEVKRQLPVKYLTDTRWQALFLAVDLSLAIFLPGRP